MTTVILLEGDTVGYELVKPRFKIEDEVYLLEPMKRGVEVKGVITGIITTTAIKPDEKLAKTVIKFSVSLQTKDDSYRETVYPREKLLSFIDRAIIMNKIGMGQKVDWTKFEK